MNHPGCSYHSNAFTNSVSITPPIPSAQIHTMSDSTFHTTAQDVRKAESKLAQSHGGKPPANSDVSQMKVSIPLSTATIELYIY